MSKMKKIILIFLCLPIIGGVLYGASYVKKVNGEYVRDMNISEKNISKTNKVALIKEEGGKIVKSEDKTISEVKIITKKELGISVIANPKVKTQEYKKALKKPSDMVIVIDPGHASRTSLEKEQQAPGSNIMKIKEPGGAQGINTKTPEYVVNMAVAVRLKSLLEGKGYKVIMTKTDNKQMLGNIARAQVGNKAKADLVIRIHADSNNDSSVKGASMLVPADSKNTNAIYKTSKKYGEIVFNNLIHSIGMKNRGVVERNDLTGFNWSVVPVILVEMGFQSNVEEDKLLVTENYQNKLAKALSEGIDKALIQ
ncbi:N-acetylmuramoyl-L-alanine amidase [Clostridium estertheticum]|uniref:N-acetylmuramoyl-L-alanine amidase family protein n=1 Tax=Clostridium estertheticum TaxID=238834 RepID=UPI001CD13CD2|nr:N-acetylmuramoyl-L-alanine amidase [Clostridium estertheticum]MBZ9689175.1 N-acetylmuramoyl-L-alanine amidase [Clostridium estertheticum]